MYQVYSFIANDPEGKNTNDFETLTAAQAELDTLLGTVEDGVGFYIAIIGSDGTTVQEASR